MAAAASGGAVEGATGLIWVGIETKQGVGSLTTLVCGLVGFYNCFYARWRYVYVDYVFVRAYHQG